VGRAYAKVYRDIWTDPDFTGQPAAVQYLYLFLLSQPNLNAAGVLPLTIRRWAAAAGRVQAADIESDLTILEKARYVVVDYGTEELLIRTYVRNDEIWRIPNTLYSVLRDAERVSSTVLRQALADEFSLLPVDDLDGKRAEAMKLQVTTVTATLRLTVGVTVGETARQRKAQLYGGQPVDKPAHEQIRR
jgi:hypothetical protein